MMRSDHKLRIDSCATVKSLNLRAEPVRLPRYPIPAAPQSPADSPKPPHLAKAPRSPDPESSPKPPYSVHPPEAAPSPATPRTVDKSKCVAPLTSAAASPPRFAQTCKPQPTCPPSQSRACSADSA